MNLCICKRQSSLSISPQPGKTVVSPRSSPLVSSRVSLLKYWLHTKYEGRFCSNISNFAQSLATFLLKEDLKSASRFRLKKILKESVISKYYIGELYMQLVVCTAVVLSCFFVYSFECVFVYLSQLKYILYLCVFICICLFITTLISSYFSSCRIYSARLALICYFWVAVLSFFHIIISFKWLYTFVSRAR